MKRAEITLTIIKNSGKIETVMAGEKEELDAIGLDARQFSLFSEMIDSWIKIFLGDFS